MLQLRLGLPPSSYSTTISVLLQGSRISISFTLSSFSLCAQLKWQNQWDNSFFPSWLILGLLFKLELGDLFVAQNQKDNNFFPSFRLISQNPWQTNVLYFQEKMLFCAYTICLYGEISVFCTVPKWSPPAARPDLSTSHFVPPGSILLFQNNSFYFLASLFACCCFFFLRFFKIFSNIPPMISITVAKTRSDQLNGS